MARMIAEVYDALKSAGAPEEQARAAATAVAGQWDSDTQVGTRMDRLEGRMDGLDARMDRLEGRMDGLDARMNRLEGRMDRLEEATHRVEQRVGKVESDLAVVKWMVGFTLAVQIATLFFIWQLMLRLPG